MSDNLHGSDGEQGSPKGDMDRRRTGGVGDEAEVAPNRRAFKRLRKAVGASHERPAAGMRSLEDWTDDEDADVSCALVFLRSAGGMLAQWVMLEKQSRLLL